MSQARPNQPQNRSLGLAWVETRQPPQSSLDFCVWAWCVKSWTYEAWLAIVVLSSKSSWEIYYPVWSLTLITEYGSIQKYFGAPTSWEDQVYAQIVHTKCSFIFQDASYKASKHIDKISLWNCQARAREKWPHPTWESLNTVWITSVARQCSLLRGGENSLSSVYCTWLLYKSTTRFKLSTGCSAHLELGFITILSTTCSRKGIILL